MDIPSEINATYYAMKLIRHRSSVATMEHLMDKGQSELSSSELALALEIVDEIQRSENVPLNTMSEAKAESHLDALANSVQLLANDEISSTNYVNGVTASNLLDQLRSDPLYQRPIYEVGHSHEPSSPIEKRATQSHGQSGKSTRRDKAFEGYAVRLREKQKVKRIYFVLEGQFRNYFERAARMKGITGENLLRLLERRLDNAVYRAGFATSRRQARQLVNHGHVQVNGRKVDIPSYQVKPNDMISIRSESYKKLQESRRQTEDVQFAVPGWLVPIENLGNAVRVRALPTVDDIESSIDVQLIGIAGRQHRHRTAPFRQPSESSLKPRN